MPDHYHFPKTGPLLILDSGGPRSEAFKMSIQKPARKRALA